jgi:tight adherence protein C
MLELLIDRMQDTKFLTMLLAGVAAVATVLTLTMPLLSPDTLGRRMKSVALEREKIRQRERERMARGEKERVTLRQTPKQYMQRVVERFNLTKWLAQEEAREKLVQAGYRGQAPYVAFLFFRLVTPAATLLFAVFYLFVVVELDQPPLVKIGICLAAAYLGMQLPYLLLKNRIAKRQLSIKRAFPDALDLLLICVESGMSIEAAFKKVSLEIGSQSVALAEELTLTTAELSYLQDRKLAYENLAKRTDLEGVRSVCMALQQAERYGTPLGQTLRVMSQENRDMRMTEAEKKAAALPPKLTVPMILFFLPVLFIVILGPAAIRVMATQDTSTSTPVGKPSASPSAPARGTSRR